MVKAFARWLYMKTHRNELIQVANVVRQQYDERANIVDQAKQLGVICGANDALEKLDLLIG